MMQERGSKQWTPEEIDRCQDAILLSIQGSAQGQSMSVDDMRRTRTVLLVSLQKLPLVLSLASSRAVALQVRRPPGRADSNVMHFMRACGTPAWLYLAHRRAERGVC